MIYWKSDLICKFQENSFSKHFGTGTFNTFDITVSLDYLKCGIRILDIVLLKSIAIPTFCMEDQSNILDFGLIY